MKMEKGGNSWCQSPFSFFGLPSSYRKDLHEQIFQLSFNSKGMFSFSEVYTMPIYLRNFYYKRISKYYEDERKEYEKAKSGMR